MLLIRYCKQISLRYSLVLLLQGRISLVQRDVGGTDGEVAAAAAARVEISVMTSFFHLGV